MYARMESQYGGNYLQVIACNTLSLELLLGVVLSRLFTFTQDAHVHILSMGPEDPSAAYVSNHRYNTGFPDL